MGNRTDSYFYISGFLSLLLLILLLILAIKMLFTPSKRNIFAMKKDSYISISLEIPKVVSSQKVEKKRKRVAEPEVKPAEEVDVNNLFSEVWTKKIKLKKRPIEVKNRKRLLAIQKKIATVKENDVQSLSQDESKLETTEQKSKTKTSSTAPEVNEYLAKIQAIVKSYFHVPQNSAGSIVKAVIELDALGKVIDFRVLNYSQNEALNDEVNLMKERLLYVVFPKNPEHTSSKTVIILKSKE